MPIYRIGKTFEGSFLCSDEPTSREELKKAGPGANAWRYWPKSRHWELCKVDCRTGELFTVHELELLAARGELK